MSKDIKSALVLVGNVASVNIANSVYGTATAIEIYTSLTGCGSNPIIPRSFKMTYAEYVKVKHKAGSTPIVDRFELEAFIRMRPPKESRIADSFLHVKRSLKINDIATHTTDWNKKCIIMATPTGKNPYAVFKRRLVPTIASNPMANN